MANLFGGVLLVATMCLASGIREEDLSDQPQACPSSAMLQLQTATASVSESRRTASVRPSPRSLFGGPYLKIAESKCSDMGLLPIDSVSECRAAAISVSGSASDEFADISSETLPAKPHGCFLQGGAAKLNLAAPGSAAGSTAEAICKLSVVDDERFAGVYKMISSGSCSSKGMVPIASKLQCEIAASSLGLFRTVATASADLARPKGCYSLAAAFTASTAPPHALYFNTNPANKDEASATRQMICRAPADASAYQKITSGSCNAKGMSPILYPGFGECLEAVVALEAVQKIPTVSADAPRPPGCYDIGGAIVMNRNVANINTDADTTQSIVCKKGAGPRLKVGFLGNSQTYFNDLPHVVKHFLESAGVDGSVEVGAGLSGGASISSLWDTNTASDLGKKSWDVIILQDITYGAAQPGSRAQSLAKLRDVYLPWLKAMDPKPLVVFYQMYGYKDNAATASKGFADFTAMNDASIEGYNAYVELLQKSGINATAASISVGFAQAHQKLNQQWVKLYHDGRHPSAFGSWLVGSHIAASIANHDKFFVSRFPRGLNVSNMTAVWPPTLLAGDLQSGSVNGQVPSAPQLRAILQVAGPAARAVPQIASKTVSSTLPKLR